jgi:hypothetical protein
MKVGKEYRVLVEILSEARHPPSPWCTWQESWPISQREWAFQERLLPGRNLHFGSGVGKTLNDEVVTKKLRWPNYHRISY